MGCVLSCTGTARNDSLDGVCGCDAGCWVVGFVLTLLLDLVVVGCGVVVDCMLYGSIVSPIFMCVRVY